MGRTVKEFAPGIRWFPTFPSTVLYSTVWDSAVHYSTLRDERQRPIACFAQTLSELSETPCFLPGHGSRGDSHSYSCDRHILRLLVDVAVEVLSNLCHSCPSYLPLSSIMLKRRHVVQHSTVLVLRGMSTIMREGMHACVIRTLLLLARLYDGEW